MTFATVRQEGSTRLQEVNILLGEIRAIESRGIHERDASLPLKKGLFFVTLYASFEYIVNRSISEAANQIQQSNVKTRHLHHRMHPLALDPQFMSIASPGKDAKWERRSKLFEMQQSTTEAVIHDTALTKELGNIWCNAFRQVFLAFGISENHIHDASSSRYIDEVVDNRNKVAHGRESASDVGQGYTTQMLELRLNAVEAQKEYFISILEKFVRDKEYINPTERALYP